MEDSSENIQSPVQKAASEVGQMHNALEEFMIAKDVGPKAMAQKTLESFGILPQDAADLIDGREAFEIAMTQEKIYHTPEEESDQYKKYLRALDGIASKNQVTRKDLIDQIQKNELDAAFSALSGNDPTRKIA